MEKIVAAVLHDSKNSNSNAVSAMLACRFADGDAADRSRQANG
jgi:hypothetical protein